MSSVVVTFPIVKALVEAEKILGPNRQWIPTNKTQTRFLKEFFAVCRSEHIPEIESLASRNAAEIQEFLARHGFNFPDIPPFGEHEFGTASVLDLLAEWTEKGIVAKIRRRKSGRGPATTPRSRFERIKARFVSPRQNRTAAQANPARAQSAIGRYMDTIEGFRSGLPLDRNEDLEVYPAVLIERPHITAFRAPSHPHPIVSPETKSSNRVYMTMLDVPPAGFDLIAKAQEIRQEMKLMDDFEGLIFPMVTLNQSTDVGWVVGMETTGASEEPWKIACAVQQTRLRMNEYGARAESAAFMGMLMGLPPPPYVIDQPFLIWFEREGLSKPIFVGHITEEDWKNPGNISR